jgi:hypothetical protein
MPTATGCDIQSTNGILKLCAQIRREKIQNLRKHHRKMFLDAAHYVLLTPSDNALQKKSADKMPKFLHFSLKSVVKIPIPCV